MTSKEEDKLREGFEADINMFALDYYTDEFPKDAKIFYQVNHAVGGSYELRKDGDKR